MWDEDEDNEEDDDELVRCSYCGTFIYEDAERCPNCERYRSREDEPRSRPTWIVVVVVICLAIVLLWTLR